MLCEVRASGGRSRTPTLGQYRSCRCRLCRAPAQKLRRRGGSTMPAMAPRRLPFLRALAAVCAAACSAAVAAPGLAAQPRRGRRPVLVGAARSTADADRAAVAARPRRASPRVSTGWTLLGPGAVSVRSRRAGRPLRRRARQHDARDAAADDRCVRSRSCSITRARAGRLAAPARRGRHRRRRPHVLGDLRAVRELGQLRVQRRTGSPARACGSCSIP